MFNINRIKFRGDDRLVDMQKALLCLLMHCFSYLSSLLTLEVTKEQTFFAAQSGLSLQFSYE